MGRPGTTQMALVSHLKENNGSATINVKEFATKLTLVEQRVVAALHGLLNKGVLKKTLEGVTDMSTDYTLIGELPVSARNVAVRRRNNGLSGDLLQRAMEQVATLKATQDQLLAAFERIKELEKTVLRLDKQVVDQKQELQSTDIQLAQEQQKFLDLLQSVEKNSKVLTKKIEFDGRGFQRTTGV